jgi:hypothetical protein
MALTKISFAGGTKVGYVVRYKAGHTDDATDGGGHSDCVLPTGAPVGYFGSGAIGGTGVVYGYSQFAAGRPEYVNLADAKAKPCKSTLLVMDVGTTRADAFLKSWLSMRAKTDGFTIIGNNCSTHASRAVFAAGATTTAEVSGTDTPNNLYEQIVKASLVPWRSYSGWLAFNPISSGGDELMLDFEVEMDVLAVPVDGGPAKVPAFIKVR